MGVMARLAALHRLDDAGWARHANPWSGWSRVATTLPLLALAVWSRVWIGWWSLPLVAVALAWILLNPRAFPPARDDRAWITRGVLGERMWVEAGAGAIAGGLSPRTISAVVAAGAPLFAWGLWRLELWPTLLGAAVVVLGKLWFVDRMAVLYDAAVADRPDLRYRLPAPGPMA